MESPSLRKFRLISKTRSKPPNTQAFQVEFRGDPQVQGHVQGLVVGDEGPGRGAPGNGLHHGGFHLQEAPGLEKLPHQTDDRGPPDKNLPHLGVDHQVQVALAVAGLHVGEAVELFRQGQETLGEEDESRSPPG